MECTYESHPQRRVVAANAVVVRNAQLAQLGSVSGSFEVFGPDCCMRPQADGRVHITVNCHVQGEGQPGSTLQLSARQWDCLAVIGYDGPVISALSRD